MSYAFPSDRRSTERRGGESALALIISAVWWGWIPLLYVIVRWGIFGLFANGFQLGRGIDQFFMRNFWSGAPLGLLYLVIGFIGQAVILILSEINWKRGAFVATSAALVMAIFASSYAWWISNWDTDKDAARFYLGQTTFVAPSLEALPNSLGCLSDRKVQRCVQGPHDTPSNLVEGTLDLKGWDARIGSLDGAKIALARRTGDEQKISLDPDSVTYLNAWSDSTGSTHDARWSGILDGSGISVPMGGVVEWDGSSTSQCLFEGQYAIGRALHGERMNNLPNLLADRFPSLRFETADAWGYCDGAKPVVVLPVTRPMYWKWRTVSAPAGVLVVTGDNGKTRIEHVTDVTPGTFPGPVYPMTTAAKQREYTKWAAGRENMKRNGFGFEPADSAAQAGNVSEYLLRNVTTGRMEWVTPLTLRHSTSQLIVAYSVVPADEVHDGQLQPMKVYALADNDPRRINIDALETDAIQYLVGNYGTFQSNGGKLVEFTPVDGQVWRAFGEIKGQVVLRLDIDAARKVPTKLVQLGVVAADAGDTVVCGQPKAGLTNKQLAQCVAVLSGELATRS